MVAFFGSKRRWGGIGTKLFLSYLLVASVGVATLFLAVSYLAPVFFEHSMTEMMGSSMSGMMSETSHSAGAEIGQAFQQAMTFSLRLAAGAAGA